jgi:hypothetical protein
MARQKLKPIYIDTKNTAYIIIKSNGTAVLGDQQSLYTLHVYKLYIKGKTPLVLRRKGGGKITFQFFSSGRMGRRENLLNYYTNIKGTNGNRMGKWRL